MLRAPITAGLLIGCYLVFAGTVSATELVTAAGIGVAGMVWVGGLRRVARSRFGAARGQAGAWRRAIGTVPGATVKTGLVLAGAIVARAPDLGRADACRFDRGKADDAAARTRRAVAVLAASLAPASYVVAIEPERDAALIHGIGRAAPYPNPEWLA